MLWAARHTWNKTLEKIKAVAQKSEIRYGIYILSLYLTAKLSASSRCRSCVRAAT